VCCFICFVAAICANKDVYNSRRDGSFRLVQIGCVCIRGIKLVSFSDCPIIAMRAVFRSNPTCRCQSGYRSVRTGVINDANHYGDTTAARYFSMHHGVPRTIKKFSTPRRRSRWQGSAAFMRRASRRKQKNRFVSCPITSSVV